MNARHQTDTIYILEDDTDLATVYMRALKGDGYTVEIFDKVNSFAERIEQAIPSLTILDLSLPDGDGLSVLQNLLAKTQIPVIVASGRDGLGDKVMALRSGADDYIVKPVEPLELVARVHSVLRRSEHSVPEEKCRTEDCIAEFAGWTVHFSSYEMQADDGTTETLSQSDAKLLHAFVDAPGRVLSREFLISTCDLDCEVYDRSIDVRISRLRKKIHDNPKSPKIIKTVYGAGYILSTTVNWTRPGG